MQNCLNICIHKIYVILIYELFLLKETRDIARVASFIGPLPVRTTQLFFTENFTIKLGEGNNLINVVPQ